MEGEEEDNKKDNEQDKDNDNKKDNEQDKEDDDNEKKSIKYYTLLEAQA